MQALRGSFPRSKRKDGERWVVIGGYLPAPWSCPRISKTPFRPVGMGQIVPKNRQRGLGADVLVEECKPCFEPLTPFAM